MAIEIRMPRLSQTTDEVRLINWLVKEGDRVQKGDPICEVETDKVTMAVESYEGGTVLKLLAAPDSIVDAGTVIVLLGKPGEKVVLPSGKPSEVSIGKASAVEPQSGGEEVSLVSEEFGVKPDVWNNEGIKATPLVRNIARKKGVDLGKVKGSGPRGLITKRDIELYLESAAMEGGVREEAARGEIVPPPKRIVPEAGAREVALSRNQLTVARNLLRSKTTIPHYYLKTEVFTDGLLRWRLRCTGKDGTKASVYSFLIYAVSRALKQHLRLNASFRDDKLILFERVNIGFAVSRGDELYVPVLRDADSKSIEGIDREVKWLMAKVRNERLEPADITGGTFTITNLGIYKVDEFLAIINPTQSGILAVGRMKKTLFIDDAAAMSIRNACTVTGSFDHRIVNGAQGAAFLEEFKKIVEDMQ